ISAVGVVMSSCVSNRAPRVALAMPAARAIVEALRYPKQSSGSAAVGLATFLAFGEMTTLFVTASTGALLVQGLLPEPAASQFTWGYWFLAALVPNAILFALSYGAILVLYRPESLGRVDIDTVRLQRELLGPL